VKLAKAHGLGNDFLLVAASDAAAAAGTWITRVCDRHTGMGADGVLVYELQGETVRMRLFNADGGEVEISGNGLRCLASYVVWKGWAPARHVVETGAGPRQVEVQPLGRGRFRVNADLGMPIFESRAIPINLDPPLDRVVDLPLRVLGRDLRITATSLGNPHCAVFVDAPPDDESLTALGRALESHPAFPRRTNVELITVLSETRLRVRFWERGVGLTQASGTGAGSAAVAAILNGRVGRHVVVDCDGGRLEVAWPEAGRVSQVGETELVFEGEWLSPR
jgi:diaminopimelate epimerase